MNRVQAAAGELLGPRSYFLPNLPDSLRSQAYGPVTRPMHQLLFKQEKQDLDGFTGINDRLKKLILRLTFMIS